jgi:hypothetical protein
LHYFTVSQKAYRQNVTSNLRLNGALSSYTARDDYPHNSCKILPFLIFRSTQLLMNGYPAFAFSIRLCNTSIRTLPFFASKHRAQQVYRQFACCTSSRQTSCMAHCPLIHRIRLKESVTSRPSSPLQLIYSTFINQCLSKNEYTYIN